MSKLTFPLLLSVALLTTALHAAPPDSVAPFVGKWKLDPTHSRLTDQMKVDAAGPNTYMLNFSGDNVETIVADGTDQTGLYGSTVAIKAEDARHWDVIRKTKGRTNIVGKWELSTDGKTLTDSFTSFHDNGTTTNLHYIYQRIARPAVGDDVSGFVGTWESTTEDVNSSYELEVQAFKDDGLSFINAGGQVTQSLLFDGKDYPGSGTGAPQGYVSAGRRINDHTVERVDKIDGKILYTQQIEISADGKTLTMTVHIPGRDKPGIMVFNRE